MTTSGRLRERISLQRQALDAKGRSLGQWTEAARFWADLIYLRGGEQVMAQRLQGVQTVVMTVRVTSVSAVVDNAWRAVNVRSRQIYDIKAAVLSDDRAFVQITALARSNRRTREGGDLTDG